MFRVSQSLSVNDLGVAPGVGLAQTKMFLFIFPFLFLVS